MLITSQAPRFPRLRHILARYLQAEILSLRSNVFTVLYHRDTRLRKLDASEHDAIILAAVGLRRRGIPADFSTLVLLSDRTVQATTGAEMRCLGTGCYLPLPVAASTTLNTSEFNLHGLTSRDDREPDLRQRAHVLDAGDCLALAEHLGIEVAAAAWAEGADAIIEELAHITQERQHV